MTGHPPSFAHLHIHSEYSLSDGAIKISEMIDKVASQGHQAVALTDHGNLFGAVEFYLKAKDKDIKPIIGSEIYHAGNNKIRDYLNEHAATAKTPNACHLILLAKNNQGYKNLVKIVSLGYLDQTPNNHDSVPVVKESVLDQNAENLIALSSCMRGEFGLLLRCLIYDFGETVPDFNSTDCQEHQAFKLLTKHVEKMCLRFGVDNYYIELIDNNLPDQKTFLQWSAGLARHFEIPLVCSADAHYLNDDDREAHALLVGIKNDLTVSKMRDRRRNSRFHLLDDQEIHQIYAPWPDAIANTLKIADACEVTFEFGNYVLPNFDLGTGESTTDALKRIAQEGLEQRLVTIKEWYGEDWDEAKLETYQKRLEYELSVIISMGFPGYFLIVQDFINWAKGQDIPVGPGRGSGAGSLVAYALRITDLDPLPYNLIFERFLNPERVSMPDFDIDFCQERRDEVIKYVTERYGANNVAQITTFGKMLAKAALRDVGRVLEVSYGKVDRIAKLIPNELGIKLKDAIVQEPRITEEARRDPMIEDMLKYALKLEGLCRHTSVHAAGIVIAEGGMENNVPVYQGDDGSLITQFEMKNAEKVGLVKFDFLGLKTLTVIQKAVRTIRATKDSEFNIEKIPLDDSKVYKLISGGQSIGVFQLETGGMRQLLPRLKPSTFEDIIALVALFRPGPLGSGMVDDFIERKHGRKQVEYLIPQLEPILKETYGTIVYQEQVQKIAAILANYSLGEADLLRRAMGKKKPEEMAKQRERFIAGCLENEIDSKIAEELFDMMAMFAEYGFNKSHSAAYGLVSYQTAYLKTHYPEEYMAAILTCDMDNTDKVSRYIEDCRYFRINVLAPDINESTDQFTVPKAKTIRFAMSAIKGLGLAAVQPIIDDRKINGPFTSLSSLAKRVQLSKVGKKTLETLVNAGAFDRFGEHRASLRASMGDLVKYSENLFNARSNGQRLLFEEDEAQDIDDNFALKHQNEFKWDSDNNLLFEDLQIEKNLLGVYVSAHPLDRYQQDIKCFGRAQLAELPKLVEQSGISVVCMLEDVFERTTKDGRQMTLMVLNDRSTRIQIPWFDDNNLPCLDLNQPVVATFKVLKGFDGNPRSRLESMKSLEDLRRHRLKAIKLCLGVDESKLQCPQQMREEFDRIASALARQAGDTAVLLKLGYAKGNVYIRSGSVDPSDKILAYLKFNHQQSTSIEYEL
jgi:DNA polymerase III subunit alpha